MARTSAAAALSATHRRGQLQIRARALQDFIRLWPLWDGDRASFARLVQATIPLVRVHHRVSAAVAARYFEAFREAEGIGGKAPLRLADSIDVERVTASLYVTGEAMTGKAIQAGHSPQAAMQTALVRTSGAVGRHVLTGARDTLVRSSAVDPRANGWGRMTSGNACAFCEELAAGGVLSGEDAAGFAAHDHCACMAEPAY